MSKSQNCDISTLSEHSSTPYPISNLLIPYRFSSFPSIHVSLAFFPNSRCFFDGPFFSLLGSALDVQVRTKRRAGKVRLSSIYRVKEVLTISMEVDRRANIHRGFFLYKIAVCVRVAKTRRDSEEKDWRKHFRRQSHNIVLNFISTGHRP